MKGTINQTLTALANIDSGILEFTLDPDFYPAPVVAGFLESKHPEVAIEARDGMPPTIRIAAENSTSSRAAIGNALNALIALSCRFE
jgi:hypothetical protein